MVVERCKKWLGSVQLDKINHCFPFIFVLFISRERTRNFASNVLGLTGEKCMDVEKNGGRKIFFQLLGLWARSHSTHLLSVQSEPKINFRCGLWARANELMV